MGRFFFPGLPALSLLVFYGLGHVAGFLARVVQRLQARGAHLRARPRAQAARLALVANGGMLALSLLALFGYLAPAYANPPAYAGDAPIPNRVDARFDTLATLRGYELSTRW
jgi:hypothetical protein